MSAPLGGSAIDVEGKTEHSILNLFGFGPSPARHSVLLVYKNMAQNREVSSHTGLGVTAQNVAKVLRASGVQVEVVPVFDGYELRDKILPTRNVTHVVLFAPWVDTPFLQGLIRKYPSIAFAVTCHSNVGFLQADKHAVKLIREQLELELINHNFHVAANSDRLVNAIRKAFRRPAAELPNLYAMPEEQPEPKTWARGEVLRLGVFGAMRPQKNMLSAAWAGLQIATQLCTRAEIAINSGRVEGGNSVLGAIRELLAGLEHVQLVEAGWMNWPKFRSFVGSQHLLLSPSYTESFCNVTADGVVEGVPSVVTSAISWVPRNWQADGDNVDSIANTGIRLLSSRRSARQGWEALEDHNDRARRLWLSYLDRSAVFSSELATAA